MAKKTRVAPARKETSVALEKGICLLVESIGLIKQLSSTNFSIANILISSSKTTAVPTCSVEQHFSNSKESIIHTLHACTDLLCKYLKEGKGSNINRNPTIVQCTFLNMKKGVKNNNIVKIEETFDVNTDTDAII